MSARLAGSGILSRMNPDFFPLRPWSLVACVILLAAAPEVFAATAAAPAAGTSWPVPVGQPLPDVVMSGLNGPPRSLSSYRGRPMIINVWASWCGPCRAEAASLERLAWSKAGGRYAIIGVSIDDYRAEALRWLGHSNATISHYIDARLTLEHLLGASTIPTTV
ncbi:MAG TPA: TlpA disulfide reductase family protein, partial [Steroidobacteraceae bacterium]|nr:TlpA disulfide reductase family protein [Steroidobacteraceae bacterium]